MQLVGILKTKLGYMAINHLRWDAWRLHNLLPFAPAALPSSWFTRPNLSWIVPQADSSPTGRAIGPEIPWFPVSKVEPLPGCICLWHISTCFAANLFLDLYIIWVLEMWCRNRYVVISRPVRTGCRLRSHQPPTCATGPILCEVQRSQLRGSGAQCLNWGTIRQRSHPWWLQIYKWLNPNRKEEKCLGKLDSFIFQFWRFEEVLCLGNWASQTDIEAWNLRSRQLGTSCEPLMIASAPFGKAFIR